MNSDINAPFPFAFRYQPLVPVAIALATGVILDRNFSPPFFLWLTSAIALLSGWASVELVRRIGATGSERSLKARPAVVHGAIMVLAAAWHHVYWNAYPANDVGNWCDRHSRPAWVRGVLADEPLVVRPGPRNPLCSVPDRTRTLCRLKVRQIRVGNAWMDASGTARLRIDGVVSTLRAGQAVNVLGKIIAPPAAMNPGEFDYANQLRGQRIRALMDCDDPEGVTAIAESNHWQYWLQRIAGACERRLMNRLPAGQGEIAVALLLGRYELLDDIVTERYVRTGTMHILAISGQHLAVVAGFLWFSLRFVPLPRKCGAVLLGALVVCYALLTGMRPPVLRAAVLVCVLVGAIILDARSRRANPLALALTIVLVINPTDLFDRGLQLSFLAIGALSWMVDPIWKLLQRDRDALEPLLDELRPWWLRILRSFASTIAFAFVTSGVVWLANVPLLASRFHLFSPIVVPLTVILTPAATIALMAGLGLLLVDAWLPTLGELLARICGFGITAMDRVVDIGSRLPGGYWYVAGPPNWWIAGFYLGMLGIVLFRPHGAIRLRCIVVGIAWLGLGFAVASLRPTSDSLQCQILAVGNGSAAILRLPSGRCVLIDAGQIAGPHVGSRIIAPALWDAGVTRIDAIFISHADVDHYNGVPQLLERFRVASVYVPPHFARADQEPVRLVTDALRRRNVNIRICLGGDTVEFGEGVSARVLHPPAEFGGSDNEQSLVLLLEYRGKRVLFPGDLEGAGLKRLLNAQRADVDVLISPHHGSRRANPPELAEWCMPELVVVSQGRPRSGATLNSFRDAGIPVLTTNDCGAITLTVDAERCDATYVQLPTTAN